MEYALEIEPDMTRWEMGGSVDEQQALCSIRVQYPFKWDIAGHSILYECDTFSIELEYDRCIDEEDRCVEREYIILWIGYDSDLYNIYSNTSIYEDMDNILLKKGVKPR